MVRLAGVGVHVRLPRQPGGTATIESEHRWLPYVAASLPVPVPEILAMGDPGFGYPERWSVVRWLHADLVAENLLVHDDRLAGVLDFGGLGVGDPTVDLAVAWDVLDAAARGVFRDLVEVDDATWLRGRGWALALGLMTFPYYWSTMPARCSQRLAMTKAVLADAGA